ncbi:unnamed protein product [Bursaphelenchus xylophilus]|uniref:(pine wood nematode) hypothetical protein n=1 Tax=Bursaphelenchus xylophilus TaxID=6326 RepID=A0A1I7RNM6_BURXY|nr:unnamed protein product [Bursaphelenchus xylophilus]CAG9124164.1 unnamed protein product [Bursaphelenchus xylophilus]
MATQTKPCLQHLPPELKMKICEHLDVMDYFSLLRCCVSWNRFITHNAERLSTFKCFSLRIEEYSFIRFRFKVSTVGLRNGEETRLKRFCFRTPDDLGLFLRMVEVAQSLILSIKSCIGLQDKFERVCKGANEVSIRVQDHEGIGSPVSVEYLSELYSRLQLNAISVEDLSSNWTENGMELIKACNATEFLEIRSSVKFGGLKLGDDALAHVARMPPLETIVLSTVGSIFTKEAVKDFLDNVGLKTNMYLEFYRVSCSSNDFYRMLKNELNVIFETDPTRGTFNSFHILYRGFTFYLNIKYFDDSQGLVTYQPKR